MTPRPQRVVVSGGTGLIGTSVCRLLAEQGIARSIGLKVQRVGRQEALDINSVWPKHDIIGERPVVLPAGCRGSPGCRAGAETYSIQSNSPGRAIWKAKAITIILRDDPASAG